MKFKECLYLISEDLKMFPHKKMGGGEIFSIKRFF